MAQRRPSLTARLAEHADRLAFTVSLLLNDVHDRPSCCYKLCRGHEAIVASAERIRDESLATVAEYQARERRAERAEGY